MERWIDSEELEMFLNKKAMVSYRGKAADFEEYFDEWVTNLPKEKWDSYLNQFNKQGRN